MSDLSSKYRYSVIQLLVLILGCVVSTGALAKTWKVNCVKKSNLQSTINSASNGDTVEITGICMENILIKDKALTLIGATTGGPHGITGIAANTDGVRIESSRGVHLEDLVINTPLSTGVRMLMSQVSMTDCEVSDSGDSIPGKATGIWVQQYSDFVGTRLQLDRNRIGLAAQQSQAFCRACDFHDNTVWAGFSSRHSTVSLLDSEVTGNQGITANSYSYIDIDCLTYTSDPAHNCELDVADVAGWANLFSTVAFYDSGDFSGRFEATQRSEVDLFGARQQSNPGENGIDGNSSLRVEPFSGNSRLMGTTNVYGFSNALFSGSSTVLDGNINCGAGGDAWADPAIGLGTVVISGCSHAPDP